MTGVTTKGRGKKLDLCAELWKEMPEATSEEVAEAFEKRHGEPCSLVTVRKARGGKAERQPADEPITADELKRLKAVAEADGGLDELDRRLQAVEAVVKHFYGLERVRAVLNCLKDLIG
jgi:hypothetical protein